jgi:tetratricopeptide (TPR) repeat protein
LARANSHATNNAERAALAVQGIDACRQALAHDPKSAPAHFYLGMNLGQLARTKLLGALPLVGEMEHAFQTAAALNERFGEAGPDRCLGLLYFEAPAIGSIGSRTKARKHLERAAELVPGFPENRLNLGEAYLKWREKKLLRREVEALEKIWSTARTNFAGAEWEAAWLDWEQRRDNLRKKAESLTGPSSLPRTSD